MPSVRLNVFQKLVLQWEALHPYNGAQILHLAGPIPSNLTSTWQQTLTSLHLGPVSSNGRSYFLSTPQPAATSVETPPPGSSLEAVMSDHLNRYFLPNELPFRLIALANPDNTHHLALVYHHWVADSVSIRRVLHDLFLRLHAPSQLQSHPLHLSAGGYWSLFGPSFFGGALPWSLPGSLIAAIRQTAHMKRVQRVEHHSTDFTSAFSSLQLPDGTLSKTLAFARNHSLRVNDVLLAAIALALRDHGPLTPTSSRRDFAFGSIVDLRPHAPESLQPDLDHTFNLYLGFTTTFLTPDQLSAVLPAARALAAQSQTLRRTQAAPASMLRMAAALVGHRLFRSRASIAEWYRKRVPLSAGISNVNLRPHWPEHHHPSPLLNYLRVSPTGPMMPLVFSATTLGERLHIGLTRRTALVPPEMAHALLSHLNATLTSL